MGRGQHRCSLAVGKRARRGAQAEAGISRLCLRYLITAPEMKTARSGIYPVAGRTVCGLASFQAERRLRPLLRRAEIIDRPARVRIRERKPCLRLRRRLLGWKVRLLTVFSQVDG